MSFTNKTPNLNLPQWIDTDTPTWLVDMNNAFEKIDESVTSVKNAGDTNKTNIEAISQTQATQAEHIQDLTDKVTADTTQLSQVQAQVNVNTSHLSDLDNEITKTNETVADNFTQLQAADTTISNTVNGISATVAEHGNAITELQATTGGYDERIESAETNIQALENKDVELSGKIQANETNITSLTTEQQELSGEVATISADAEEIKTNLNNLGEYEIISAQYNIEKVASPMGYKITISGLPSNTLMFGDMLIRYIGGLSQPKNVNLIHYDNLNENTLSAGSVSFSAGASPIRLRIPVVLCTTSSTQISTIGYLLNSGEGSVTTDTINLVMQGLDLKRYKKKET